VLRGVLSGSGTVVCRCLVPSVPGAVCRMDAEEEEELGVAVGMKGPHTKAMSRALKAARALSEVGS
jgi:hypothetical protein